MSGIKAQVVVSADTPKTIYTVPADTMGTYSLIINNDTLTPGLVVVHITTTSDTLANKTIETEMGQILRIHGLLVGAGNKINITTTCNTVCTLMAGEGDV